MGASKLLKQMARKYFSRPIKKNTFLPVTISFLGFVIFLFFAVDVHYFCSLTFFSFRDMPSILLPRVSSNDSPSSLCFHFYEKQHSRERMDLVMNVSDEELRDLYASSTGVSIGGAWKPTECSSKYRVNIVIPYRQREEQLRVFLHYFHRFLQLQQIDYRIIVVEQSMEKEFNRGKLFNIGFVEAQKRFPSDCYIFHDVDLIPMNLNNIYACTRMPRHLSSAVDKFNFKLPYCNIFGGVVAISSEDFIRINGYSNTFYGWGGEDDDLYFRVSQAKLSVVRFGQEIGNYHMLSHAKEIPNPDRVGLMEKSKHQHTAEGLNSLNYTFKYELKHLYTWMFVHV